MSFRAGCFVGGADGDSVCGFSLAVAASCHQLHSWSVWHHLAMWAVQFVVVAVLNITKRRQGSDE